MKNEEAKFVLHAYRPNGADAGDATFAAALEQAQRDPVLGTWFVRQQAFDRAVAAKIASIEAPASLRASILAGAKVSQPPASTSRAWWRGPLPLAMAAGFAMMLIAVITFWPKTADAEEIAAFAINDMLHQDHEGGHGEQAAEFQALLARTEQRLGQKFAIDFTALRDNGCRTIHFQGRALLEVCFKRDGKWFHCYVARAQDFPALASKLHPTFTDQAGAGAAAWSDGQHIFVLASRAGSEAVRNLL